MRLGGRAAGVTMIVVVAAALAGCAPGGADAEGGFGLPTLSESDAAAIVAEGSSVEGALAVEANGCFTLAQTDDAAAEGAWIVWPDGARQDGAEVVLASGDRVGEGALLVGVGAAVALSDLPDGGSRDSYFGSFGRFCGADERGVLVLTGVETSPAR